MTDEVKETQENIELEIYNAGKRNGMYYAGFLSAFDGLGISNSGLIEIIIEKMKSETAVEIASYQYNNNSNNNIYDDEDEEELT
jgi:hypothetical protein